MIEETTNGIIFQAKIRTKSRKFRVSVKDDYVMVEVRSPPVQGKANTEIIRELKKAFGKEVLILRGFKSKDKVIFVNGVRKKDFVKIIDSV